jgi:hypothetical protein
MSLNTAPPGSAATETSRRWQQRDRPIFAYGLMLVAAVSLVLNYFIKFPTFPDEAAASFRRYCDGMLPLQIETSDAATLERYFAAEGVPFAVRTLDKVTHTLKGGRAVWQNCPPVRRFAGIEGAAFTSTRSKEQRLYFGRRETCVAR